MGANRRSAASGSGRSLRFPLGCCWTWESSLSVSWSRMCRASSRPYGSRASIGGRTRLTLHRVEAAVLTAALPLLASDMLADTLVIHQLQRGRDVRAASVSTSLPQPVLARAGGPLDQPVLVADEVHPIGVPRGGGGDRHHVRHLRVEGRVEGLGLVQHRGAELRALAHASSASFSKASRVWSSSRSRVSEATCSSNSVTRRWSPTCSGSMIA